MMTEAIDPFFHEKSNPGRKRKKSGHADSFIFRIRPQRSGTTLEHLSKTEFLRLFDRPGLFRTQVPKLSALARNLSRFAVLMRPFSFQACRLEIRPSFV